MTITVTQVTRDTILSTPHEVLSETVGVATILLLIVLLIEQELMRAVGGLRSEAGRKALTIAIVPLLLSFALIMFTRFQDILNFR